MLEATGRPRLYLGLNLRARLVFLIQTFLSKEGMNKELERIFWNSSMKYAKEDRDILDQDGDDESYSSTTNLLADHVEKFWGATHVRS